MRILLVGALSWHPERFRALCARGHRLWGLWARSMSWDQGPYPAVADCIRQVDVAAAARTIREQRIDCVYSLFQVYDPVLWSDPAPGINHDVWTLLRILLLERARGAFDAPIVRHWGFDVHNIDVEVAAALDGHIVCNRQKHDFWTAPKTAGGCGLQIFGGGATSFLDSDRPKLEFMNDRFAEPLSQRDGELHTVCIGRPFNIDYLAAAARGIHVHVYGNSVNDAYTALARDLSTRKARASAGLFGRYLHVHEPLQGMRRGWAELRAEKSRWVEVFSRYDAGWSYIGRPLRWYPLDDLAAIPNRIGTYLLAGLPVITDVRPGSYRYEELRRLGVAIQLPAGDYDELARALTAERVTRRARELARARRSSYSFDATIEPLLQALESARERYFARPGADRTRFDVDGRDNFIGLHSARRRTPGAYLGQARARLLGRVLRSGVRSGGVAASGSG